ncbi:MAG: NADH-quinone oxidoreductase subunit L [Nocardioidaceae bacterium]|nr:NADH-quinone oxidoreductase subunit L [Nocardioidaceae bacterium]
MTLGIVLLPVIGAVVAMLAGHRRERIAPLAGVVTTAASLGAALVIGFGHWGDAAASALGPYEISTGGTPILVGLRVDQLSASMLVLATAVALLVQVYSVSYLRGDPRYPTYTALVCLFTAAMSLVVVSDDLFVLLVGWEVMGVCSYFLISHHWELEPAREGAVKAFVMTRLGDIGFLFGIFVIGEAAGTYQISGVITAAEAGSITSGEATISTLLLLCGVVGKSAQFPLHSWLPDAMPGPTPISALIHAATMVAAGVYLVARLLPVYVLSDVAMAVLSGIAVITMLGSALMALAADDLKRVLAWSTVSQLAYMFAALSLAGYGAAILHLLSHGAFKALLFLAAGSVIHAVGTQRLGQMGGLRAALPITFTTMTIGFAALAGVPPLVGFFSKDAVLGVAYEQAMHGEYAVRGWLVLVAGLLGAALTAAYSTRAWLLVFLGPRRGSTAEPSDGADNGRIVAAEPHESPWLMLGPLVLLAIPCLVGSWAVLRPGFLGIEADPLHLPVALISLGLALGAIAATVFAWWQLGAADPAVRLGKFRQVLAGEFHYDALVERVILRPSRFSALAVAANESSIVEPYVQGADTATQWSARLLRWLHDGNLQRYVTTVVLGAVALAVVIGLAQ